MKITKIQALSFFADVLGAFRAKRDQTITADSTASKLGMSAKETKNYLDACVYYGITNRTATGYAI